MRYTKLAKAEPFSGPPKINLASVFGASPQKPFLLRIPATSLRPMTFGQKKICKKQMPLPLQCRHTPCVFLKPPKR